MTRREQIEVLELIRDLAARTCARCIKTYEVPISVLVDECNQMIEGFTGERCPNCGAEAKVDVNGGLICPRPTCAAYQKLDGTWTPGYGGEQTPPVRSEK